MELLRELREEVLATALKLKSYGLVVVAGGTVCARDEKTGYIVPPKDPEKLADAIIALLTDSEKRKRMGERAKKKTQEELAWKNIALNTVEVYKKALSRKHSSN